MITVTMPQTEYEENLRKAEMKGRDEAVDTQTMRALTYVNKALEGKLRQDDLPDSMAGDVKALVQRIINTESARWPARKV